jgi:hypothetical protein
MNLNLSWDLFILVFFGVVTAYSFIIGRNQTLKVITATYVAILCSDALGNIFAQHFASSGTFLKVLGLFSIGNSDQATAFFKALILIVLIVIIAVRGMFDYDANDNRQVGFKLLIVLVLGLLSAGLMMSAMLIFVSGNSLVSAVSSPNNILADIYFNSRLVQVMVDYANLWFALPGIGIVLLSVLNKKSA